MSIIHGSQGLIYFVHEWQPKFNEAALLSDPNMLSAVTAINHRIQLLAPILHSPSVRDGLNVTTTDAEVPLSVMMKRYDGTTYVFAVAMRGKPTQATFQVQGLTAHTQVTVLDEDRTIESKAGTFTDAFQPWDVHLYRLGTAIGIMHSSYGKRVKQQLRAVPGVCQTILGVLGPRRDRRGHQVHRAAAGSPGDPVSAG